MIQKGDPLNLTGKVAVITGAGSGIGLGVAQMLSAYGASVAIVDVSPKSEAAAQELRDAGRDAAFFQCDVTNEQSVIDTVNAIVAKFGRIDILHNNAGVTVRKTIDQLEEKEWDFVLDVGLKGLFLMSKHVIPEMRKVGGGSIVNTGSGWGLKGGDQAAAYCAVKGGIGAAKTGGNYASSLKATFDAAARGFDQVLWLDGRENKYVEEVGAMNMMFVIDGKIVTAPLEGSILAGVTRKSILQLAQDMGYETEERRISVQELFDAHARGTLTEAFGTGTAAVISPVGEMEYDGRSMLLNDRKIGKISQLMYDTLVGIQRGKTPDPHGWTVELQLSDQQFALCDSCPERLGSVEMSHADLADGILVIK